tara:strand:- start:534 stop:2174 length:1641 start_codon:yes stop_codon:yes gene_type:complete
MAKELSKVEIETGNDIKAPHVTQSVDAFTGLDAYDITISGSLEVTGSTNVKGRITSVDGYGSNIGNITTGTGNIGTTSGNITAATGYVSAQNITASANISASGDIFGDDITAADVITAPLVICSSVTTNQITSPGSILSLQGPNVFTDSTSNKRGLQYNANYSASFVDRSLIDKGYFDDSMKNISNANLTFDADYSASLNGKEWTIKDGITSIYATSTSNSPNDGIFQIVSTSANPVRCLHFTNTPDTSAAGAGRERVVHQISNGGPIIRHEITYASRPKFTMLCTGRANSTPTNTTSTGSMIMEINPNLSGDIPNFHKGRFSITADADIGYSELILSRASEKGRFEIGSNGNSDHEFRFYMNGTTLPGTSGTGANNTAISGGLYIERNLVVVGVPYSDSPNFTSISDIRLKENIVTASIDTCYDGVKNLPLKYFKWKDEAHKSPPQDRNVLGWIAQDVEKVFPKAVSKGEFLTFSTFTGSKSITGSNGFTLTPGERYQDVLAGSEIIEDRQTLQINQIVKMMYGAIQKLQEKVEVLESQISGSNS